MTKIEKTIDKNQQKQDNNQVQYYEDKYYYNNNYYNTEPGVFRGKNAPKPDQNRRRQLMPDEQDRIRECYNDNIGPMTGASAKLIETAWGAGLSVDEIVMAIEETGLAPRPSGYYLKKILETWCETGVTVSRLRHECRKNEGVKWWNGR